MHAQSLRRRAQESERQPARTARTSREEDDEATSGLSRGCSPTSPRTLVSLHRKWLAALTRARTRLLTLSAACRTLSPSSSPPRPCPLQPSATPSSPCGRASPPSSSTTSAARPCPRTPSTGSSACAPSPSSVVLLPTSTKGELTPSSPRRASTTTRLAVRTALTRALRGAHADPGLCAQASSTAASRSSTRSRSSRARASPTTSTSAPPSSDGASSWCAPSPLASVRAVGPSLETELTRSCRFLFRVRAAPGLLPRRRRHDGPEHHPPGSAVLVPRCASPSRSLANL